MGCDLNWNTQQHNLIKQKQASLFIHGLLEFLDGNIGDIPYSDIEIYNGSYSGYFLNYDTLFPKFKIEKKDLDPDSIVVGHTFEMNYLAAELTRYQNKVSC